MSIIKQNISELQVLQSGAGWYLGRMYWNTEMGEGYHFWEPYSRESGYYPTKEAAQAALMEGLELRDCPENRAAYAQGLIDTQPGVAYRSRR